MEDRTSVLKKFLVKRKKEIMEMFLDPMVRGNDFEVEKLTIQLNLIATIEAICEERGRY